MTVVYDPTKVTLCIFGHNLSNLGNSAITVTPNADLISRTAGMQGEHAITKNPDRSAVLSFSLQQNARDNGILAGIIDAFDIDGTWPEAPCTLNDPSAPIIPIMRDCTLSKRPSVSYGAEQSDVQWELFVKYYKPVPQDQAGNSLVSIAAQAAGIYGAVKNIANLLK